MYDKSKETDKNRAHNFLPKFSMLMLSTSICEGITSRQMDVSLAKKRRPHLPTGPPPYSITNYIDFFFRQEGSWLSTRIR